LSRLAGGVNWALQSSSASVGKKGNTNTAAR